MTFLSIWILFFYINNRESEITEQIPAVDKVATTIAQLPGIKQIVVSKPYKSDILDYTKSDSAVVDEDVSLERD